MATLGRRSNDTRPPTRPPSPLPPLSPDNNNHHGLFSEETPRAPARIPSDEGATPAPQKRLAMFTEKLSSGTSSLARGPAQLLPGSRSHAHSRADSQLRENAGSPAPAMVPSTSGGGSSSKVHTSPSKVRRAQEADFIFIPSFLFSPTAVPLSLRWTPPSPDSLRPELYLSDSCCPLITSVVSASFKPVLTSSNALIRCAYTTQSWSHAKCTASETSPTFLTMHKASIWASM